MLRLFVLVCLFATPASTRAEQPGGHHAELLGDLQQAHARGQQDVVLAHQTADVLSEVVGVGISPAFGLAAFGIWDWYQGRGGSWYTHPAFTFPMLGLLLLIALKDVFGAPLGPAKQLADSGEVIANKVSGALGLIATMAYCADTMGAPTGQAIAMASDAILPTAYAGDASVAMGGLWGSAGAWVASIVGGACYLVVWLTGQAFTIIIFLNPFSVFDPFLKAAKTTFLLTIVGICSYFPVIGIVLASLYILFAWLVAGYCLRLMGWGMVMSWDLLFKRGKGDLADPRGILAFADIGMEGPPQRTLGWIRPGEEHQHKFEYRPWFFLPKQDHAFSTQGQYIVRGFIYPSLDADPDGGGENLLTLPPRYGGKEDELINSLGLAGLGDTPLLGGVKGFTAWIRLLFRKKKPPSAA